jgi:hypothetical protein
MHYIRENLAVCGYHHIGSRETFLSHGFGAQLQCTESYDAWLPECVEVLALPFHDGMPVPPDLFHRAQDWLAAHWDAKAKILISCAAGQSRSVTMAIALLSRKGGLRFIDAAHDVILRVPDAYPHPQVLASAARHSGTVLQAAEMVALYAAAPKQPPYPWSTELIHDAAAGQAAV